MTAPERCTESNPCPRADSDGWVYEYWADEGGEQKGKRLRPWKMSHWVCLACGDSVADHGLKDNLLCPNCGAEMEFKRETIIKGEEHEDMEIHREGVPSQNQERMAQSKEEGSKEDPRLDVESLARGEMGRLEAIMNHTSFALMGLMNFRPANAGDGGTLDLDDRQALHRCWEDMIKVQKRLLKIRKRRGWDS